MKVQTMVLIKWDICYCIIISLYLVIFIVNLIIICMVLIVIFYKIHSLGSNVEDVKKSLYQAKWLFTCDYFAETESFKITHRPDVQQKLN